MLALYFMTLITCRLPEIVDEGQHLNRAEKSCTRCNTSIILVLNLKLPILNSCSKIATKVRDLRPKISSNVRDSGQNVRTHRVQRIQLFPALCVAWPLLTLTFSLSSFPYIAIHSLWGGYLFFGMPPYFNMMMRWYHGRVYN